MKKQKEFDCVQMKWDIQQKIGKEFFNMPDYQAYQIQKKRIQANKILGPFLQKVLLLKTISPKSVAETDAENIAVSS